ncbi:odorant receptor 13a-like [Colias croceus]|uniref:odorant receptor 13a-like n=1 Tax=Colias crocea TaxID=72248 RepID=UPI001E27D68A|nr:odorant receptor 13a-like [Colias croceus]
MLTNKLGIPAFEEIFRQIKVNFWLIGIPFEESIKLRYYFLLCWLLVMVLQEFLFFISKFSAENFLDLTQLAPCTCIGILSIIKIILICSKRSSIFKFTDNLKALYKDIVIDEKKILLVKPNFVFLKYLIKYFFILNGVLISVYNFSTILLILYHYLKTNEVRFVLPYAIMIPFSVDSWGKWLFIYLHSIINGFICVLYFTTVDGLYYIMTTHICSHFIILSEEIKKLKPETSYLLNEIVKKHQYILKLSQDLEDIFTAPNLFNVLVGSIEICALGFNLTMGKWSQIPGVVLFLLSVLLQILMISVFGENIIRESRKIGESAYLCKWYTMDKKSKKTILLLMLRSNKPQKLTAYKFSVISYESFTKIISTSWSYFTILKTVYKQPEGVYNEFN